MQTLVWLEGCEISCVLIPRDMQLLPCCRDGEINVTSLSEIGSVDITVKCMLYVPCRNLDKLKGGGGQCKSVYHIFTGSSSAAARLLATTSVTEGSRI